MHRSWPRRGALALALLLLSGACSGTKSAQPGATTPSRPKVDAGVRTTAATFTVTPGVESVTVTGAPAKAKLTLVDAGKEKLLTLVADDQGQAVFRYVPSTYAEVDSTVGVLPTSDGTTLKKGDGYTVRDESASPVAVSGAFSVLGRDDPPDPALYERTELDGIPYGLTGPVGGADPNQGFGYITVRDGVKLSAMVRFPDPAQYGPGPYPTVIEYSGYGPSRPEGIEPGSRLANVLGFATVGVNMRGTGCSGGVFDLFNPAQQADGYDVVEAVARQPWVKGGKVGMIGLSYSGITQLYVGAMRPPSLAAITPLSVIEDPWRQQWPGAVYNAGFTKQWLAERDNQAGQGGQTWDAKRIAAGDTTCADNQRIRTQNIDFQSFGRALDYYPPDEDDRRLGLLVRNIDVPVYLSGAWQDEQTGGRFATMLGRFDNAPVKRFTLYNGRHPDGYTPMVLTRWFEFLSFYVARQVPEVPELIRAGAPAVFEQEFKVKGLGFEPDRFAQYGDDYQAALAAYEAEKPVRILFESGAGKPDTPEAPVARWEQDFDSFPPSDVQARTWYLGSGGVLLDQPTSATEIDRYRFDPGAGAATYTSTSAYDFLYPGLKHDWSSDAPGTALVYESSPFASDVVVAGPGYASLFFRSEAQAANLEVVLTLVQPDGTEWLVQHGWLRAGIWKPDEALSTPFDVEYTFRKQDFTPLPTDRFTEVQVPITPVAQAFRAGSKLRLIVNTPGRDTPLWSFENPDTSPEAHHYVSVGGDTPSRLVLPVLPDASAVVPGFPPCPSLRGQVCRLYTPYLNETVGG